MAYKRTKCILKWKTSIYFFLRKLPIFYELVINKYHHRSHVPSFFPSVESFLFFLHWFIPSFNFFTSSLFIAFRSHIPLVFPVLILCCMRTYTKTYTTEHTTRFSLVADYSKYRMNYISSGDDLNINISVTCSIQFFKKIIFIDAVRVTWLQIIRKPSIT